MTAYDHQGDVLADARQVAAAIERETGPAELQHRVDEIALDQAQPVTLAEVMADVHSRRAHVARGEALARARDMVALLEVHDPAADLAAPLRRLALESAADWAANLMESW